MHRAPTPKDTIFRDGTASLYRFRRPSGKPPAAGLPVLVVPSMINRWYVVDMREGVSLSAALVNAGLDTFCLDWGIPEDEDRYRTWDEVVARLIRMVRRVQRETGAPKIGVLGYCMGATLSAIGTALEPERVAALVNLCGPIDFQHAGHLGEMTHPDWFDPDAIADAGNVHPLQMQSGFVSLRPTAQVSKWVMFAGRYREPDFRDQFFTLEQWANDNIPFPAEAYRTYIRELYQENRLVNGSHRVSGRAVDLGAIACPVLTVVAERDTICPPLSARALHALVRSEDHEIITVPGGHVGAVIGHRAPEVLYPAISNWLAARLIERAPRRIEGPSSRDVQEAAAES